MYHSAGPVRGQLQSVISQVTEHSEASCSDFNFTEHFLIYSADKREIEISLESLTWQFASVRFAAVTVTNIGP